MPLNFNLGAARMYAQYSALAYDPAQPTAPKYGAVCLHAEFSDCIILAFKGTSDIRDWCTDAEFLKTSYLQDTRVHSGFARAADEILPLIIAQLLPAGADKSKIKPLCITGHSLGGALATLAAFFLQLSGFPVREVYTFASPRVGNAAWRNAYNLYCGSKTFRVICSGDVVPLIPGLFTPPLDGYRHVGTEAYLDNAGQLLLNPVRYLEIMNDGYACYWALKDRDWDFILKAHSITGDYIARLNKLPDPQQLES